MGRVCHLLAAYLMQLSAWKPGMEIVHVAGVAGLVVVAGSRKGVRDGRHTIIA
jgi:fructose-specific component phosphotransferase system IIB-like protein